MTSSTKCILHDRPMNACHVCSGSRYRIRRLYFESQSKCYSLDTGFWLNLYISPFHAILRGRTPRTRGRTGHRPPSSR